MLKQDILSHVNFNFTLTRFCNYMCSYCTQGQTQNNTKILPKSSFIITLKKLKKELEVNNIKSIDFTIMGGELSINDTFLEYFQILFDIFKNEKLKIHLNFLTNFSGKLSFFKEINKMIPNNITYECIITPHKEYLITTESKKIFFNKLKTYTNFITSYKTHQINIVFLDNFVKDNPLYNKIKTLDVNINVNELREDCGWVNHTSNKPFFRYCDALHFSMEPDEHITIPCRNKIVHFTKFKINKSIIKCRRHKCPCEFFELEFNTNISEEVVKEYQK